MSIVPMGDDVLARVTLSCTQPYLCSSCTDLSWRKHRSNSIALRGRRNRNSIVLASASVKQSHCNDFSKTKWQNSQRNRYNMDVRLNCMVLVLILRNVWEKDKSSDRMWIEPEYSTLISLRMIYILICVCDCCPVGVLCVFFFFCDHIDVENGAIITFSIFGSKG